MRNLRVYILFVLMMLAKTNVGQTDSCCLETSISVETPAAFAGGVEALLKYSRDEIGPIVQECNQDEGAQISSLKSKLTINCDGKVINVAILNTYMSESCKNKLREKFMIMPGWNPAIKDGKKVCSVVYFPIACIKWQ